MNKVVVNEIAKAGALEDKLRPYVRDLIIVLADSKRLLGMRFGNWILGAPELEAGIACASMAQDEWGHARLLYALLRDFGDDVDQLEHGRPASEYRNIAALDAEPQNWPELVAINVLVDTALTLQLEALAASTFMPLRQRVQKIVEEEAFHNAHGAAWLRRIVGAGAAGRAQMQAAVSRIAPAVLQWFGPDSARGRALQNASIVDAIGSDMRIRFIQRIAPLIAAAGSGDAFGSVEPDFSAFIESSRRPEGSAPDDRTITQVRGDKNRAFLMD
jgi:ring-1,2-phenylacetyl-CoA epoxidase subunit PaaC